jgi:hypothetical protein
MSVFSCDGRSAPWFTPAFEPEIHAPPAWLGSAGLVAFLPPAGYSQTVAPAEAQADNLGVVVTAPKRKKPSAFRPATTARRRRRARERAGPATTPVAATVPAAATTATPLNGNTMTDVASRPASPCARRGGRRRQQKQTIEGAVFGPRPISFGRGRVP